MSRGPTRFGQTANDTNLYHQFKLNNLLGHRLIRLGSKNTAKEFCETVAHNLHLVSYSLCGLRPHNWPNTKHKPGLIKFKR